MKDRFVELLPNYDLEVEEKNKMIREDRVLLIIIMVCVLVGFVAGWFIFGFQADKEYKSIQDSLLTEIQTLRSQVSLLSEPQIDEEFKFKTFALENHDPKFTDIVNIVWEKSKVHDVSPYKILSIIQVESHFNHQAVSKAGAYGLMQVQFSTWKETFNIEKPSKLFDPAFNINIGIQIYKQYKEKTNGDIEKALHHYNAGYMKVKTNYPAKVMGSKFFK